MSDDDEIVYVTSSSVSRRHKTVYHTNAECSRLNDVYRPVERDALYDDMRECKWCQDKKNHGWAPRTLYHALSDPEVTEVSDLIERDDSSE